MILGFGQKNCVQLASAADLCLHPHRLLPYSLSPLQPGGTAPFPMLCSIMISSASKLSRSSLNVLPLLKVA